MREHAGAWSWILCANAACGSGTSGADAGPPIDPLIGIGTVELVQGGYQFTEGPQWIEASGQLVFSDIPADTIYRYVPGGGAPTVHRTPSGNSNGLAVDAGGDLLAAEHGSRSVTRTEAGGTTTVVGSYGGMRLNSPNDLIATTDGTIYFTDPPYGIAPAQRELPFLGVFRVDPGGTLTAEHMGGLTERPNGIAIASAEDRLYVADSADGNVYTFPIMADGSLGARAVFVTTAGGPDGMALDAAGNLFVTTSGGVEVFSSTGMRWGNIPVPEQPANCAFAHADHRMLYITAQTGLYRVALAGAGLPRN